MSEPSEMQKRKITDKSTPKDQLISLTDYHAITIFLSSLEREKVSIRISEEIIDGEPKLETCSICCSEIDRRTALSECLHTFCAGCICEWTRRKASCPLCKRSFTSLLVDFNAGTWTFEGRVNIQLLDGFQVESLKPSSDPDSNEDLMCLDHSFFESELSRIRSLAFAAERAVMDRVREAQCGPRWLQDAMGFQASMLDEAISTLNHYSNQVALRQPGTLDPVVLMSDLHAVADTLHTLRNGQDFPAWAPENDQTPKRYSADDAWAGIDFEEDDYDDGYHDFGIQKSRHSRGGSNGGNRNGYAKKKNKKVMTH